MDSKNASESQATLTVFMGPTDANALGQVHGGVIMKLCDEAGYIAGSKHARRPVVTVAIDSMRFHSAVNIGDVLTIRSQVTWVGRSSIETRVIVTAENVVLDQITHTNSAFFVYVALDDYGRPTPVPRLILTTDEERALYEAGTERQARRLARRDHDIPASII